MKEFPHAPSTDHRNQIPPRHSVPDWQIESGELVRTFLFKDFRASLAFVNKVGDLAENAGHHPDIDIRYNKVRLALVTHDAGGITQKDFDLAAAADKILLTASMPRVLVVSIPRIFFTSVGCRLAFDVT